MKAETVRRSRGLKKWLMQKYSLSNGEMNRLINEYPKAYGGRTFTIPYRAAYISRHHFEDFRVWAGNKVKDIKVEDKVTQKVM